MMKLKQRLSEIFCIFSRRTLYTKWVVLLICIAATITLMQAGIFFLLDYMPSVQIALAKVNEQKYYWENQLVHIDLKDSQQSQRLFQSMQSHFLDTQDPAVLWMLRQKNYDIAEAVRFIESEQANFSQLATLNLRAAVQLRGADRLASAYENLEQALHKDIEIKRAVLTLLESVSLVFVLSCILLLVLSTRKVLVERLDRLLAFIYAKNSENSELDVDDEFALLEHRVSELSAKMESFETEVAWAHRTSEHIRVLTRAQSFLLRFIETVSEDVLSEKTLLKMLYSLERTMGFTNTALIYTDDAAVISTEQVIYSHHEPNPISDKVFDELIMSGTASFMSLNAESEEVECLGLSFTGSRNEVGVLVVEMQKGRFLEDAEIKVLEITAKLLSMVTKFQSHDEEGRRLAILEERAAIARELHDSLAQSLSFMKIQMARLQSNVIDDKQREVTTELREGLDNAYRELRELLTTFRVHMDLRGLGYAIQATIDEFSQRSSLAITLDNRLVNCRLTVNEEFHILHVVREALSNIVRHSGAKHVSILMLVNNKGELELTIDDDGVGMSKLSSTYDHHGQAIMKERAKTLGGDIDVMARRYGGTRVRLKFVPKLTE
ncbi:MAG: histidine kinase [Pseudomonadota bacterium]|nr:histidine kinase [Pseudomonadota bacterium]